MGTPTVFGSLQVVRSVVSNDLHGTHRLGATRQYASTQASLQTGSTDPERACQLPVGYLHVQKCCREEPSYLFHF